MANRNGTGRRTSRQLALGGIFTAFSVIILLAGGLIPIGSFAAPIFAGICLLPIATDIGTKWALLCYAAASALGAVLVPDKELVLFFIVLLGYYPILQPSINKIKYRVVRAVLKLLLFNAAVAAVYALLWFVFTSAALQAELATQAAWFWALLWGAGNFTFILYDILLDKVRIIYTVRFKNRLFK